MSSTTKLPSVEDYCRLFESYGNDISTIYLKPNDRRYELLFEQTARLLARPSPFNDSLPRPFIITAQKYVAGDEKTVRHMSYPENRHFMLSDLYDIVQLRRSMGTLPKPEGA